MGVEASHIIIVGHLFDYKTFKKLAEEKLGDDYYEKIVEPFDFVNFKSKHKQNMDDNLKCLYDGMNGEYVIYGLPLQIAYADEGEGLELFTFDEKAIEQFKKDVLIQLLKNNIHTMLGIKDFDVKVHVLTYYT